MLSMGAVAVGTLALTAVQWLPAIELSSLSERAAASTADVREFSAPGHVLVSKLFPGSLGYRPDSYWAPDTAEHEFVGELMVTLTSPSNTTVVLFDDVENGAHEIFRHLDDAVGVEDGFGSHDSAEALSSFDNEPLTGTWTLTVTDEAGGATDKR